MQLSRPTVKKEVTLDTLILLLDRTDGIMGAQYCLSLAVSCWIKKRWGPIWRDHSVPWWWQEEYLASKKPAQIIPMIDVPPDTKYVISETFFPASLLDKYWKTI